MLFLSEKWHTPLGISGVYGAHNRKAKILLGFPLDRNVAHHRYVIPGMN